MTCADAGSCSATSWRVYDTITLVNRTDIEEAARDYLPQDVADLYV